MPPDSRHSSRTYRDRIRYGCGPFLQEQHARTIVENTQSKDQQILTMDSMQSTTAKDVSAGAGYLSAMEENLGVLKAALG